MRLQSIVIPDSEQYTELYYRGRTELKTGGTLSFDTYFNSFSFTKYREYTTVKDVVFACKFTGRARIEMCVFDGQEHVISSGEFNGDAELSVLLSELPENGFLYPKIIALTDCAFQCGEYCSDCRPQKISCCIAICTYKRESYVTKNIEQLKNFEFSFIDRVFVIDNGNTLDSKSLSDGIVRILPNKNYGGSGGFTRGLIEAKDGSFSHVILMDDDIEFHPQTFEQMTVFVSLLRKECSEYWFSAAMLPIDKPFLQFELGAEWDGKKAIVHKHNADIRDRCTLLDNLDNYGVEYGGWWTLLMPVSVTKEGLPYPFFIKFDDVEYGLRKSSDAQIITMNGIAVRHEAFDKKKSFVLEYYNLRNELVVNAVYNNYGAAAAVRRFLYELAKHLFLYRYDNIPLVFRAIKDFLSGTDFFLGCDEEILNRRLINDAPKLVPLNEITEWEETFRKDDHTADKRITPAMALTLGGHLIPSFLLDSNITAVPLSRAGTSDCFAKKTIIQYQLEGSSGILTKRSFGKFLKYGFMGIGIAFKLLLCYNKAKKSYQKRNGEITSFEFWRKHLELL